MRVPTATYRLQLGREFGFAHARELLPYLDALGVSDIYTSPLLAARSGTSGYHVIDPTRIDPEIGSRADFDRLTDELRKRDMGLLLDIVPNHMAATSENPWWMDVLRRGAESRYAAFFDIDWDRHDGKVFAPALGAPLSEVLDRGELSVAVEEGEPVIRYREHAFPIDPRTIGGTREIGELLSAQHYVLGFWREAADEVNYRRFFDISDLVALRQEEPEVFEATHAFILELVREGRVTGLRVDHVDGLRDPLGYLQRLREAAGDDCPIYVEKILGPGEDLPAAWPVQGTTGYEFAAASLDALCDPEGSYELRAIAAAFTGRDEPFEDVAAAKKRQVMEELFSGQVRSLVGQVRAVLGRGAPPYAALAEALVEVTARLPVYRTYVRDRSLAPEDRRVLAAAVRDARRHLRGAARTALVPLRAVLLLERGAKRGLEFVLRWQQLTGAVAAKGVEDTALYDDVAFVARDDVGSFPGAPPGGPDEFHRLARLRAKRWRSSLSATSTHDSKRSEDVRARIAVLSEVPDRWRRALNRWAKLAAPLKQPVDGEPVPDPSEELLLYQTLVGLAPIGAVEGSELPDRLAEFARKAAREMKAHTSWTDPDEKHEGALTGFVGTLFGPEGDELRSQMGAFVQKLGRSAATNSLAQLVWKIASPGVPDLYQGTERWSLTLVDPDNRGPVDFRAAQVTIASLPVLPSSASAVRALLRSSNDGAIKLHVVRAGLALRRDAPELFARGSYSPVRARGKRAAHVLAFARRLGKQWAVAAAPRLTASFGSSGFPVGRTWDGTSLALPSGAPAAWRDVLTGERRRAKSGVLAAREVFASLPVALLVPE